MNILDKIKKISQKEPILRQFCIQTIRFKKFLENARALLDLSEDGREKFFGEYIFDRHYVVSLIDGVVERLGMMVYDACVLVPGSREELFDAYDHHRLRARNLIQSGSPGGRNGISGDAGTNLDDPEYQLLSEALRWFGGAGTADGSPKGETVMNFMKHVFFFVIQGIAADKSMMDRSLFESSGARVPDMDIYLVDLWNDALSLPEKKASVTDFSSTPLRHLLMNVDELNRKTPSNGMHAGGGWVAAVSEHQLSLTTLSPDFKFRLETLTSGYEGADFIFVFTDNTTIIDRILPAGFHVENSNYGQFAWSLDVSTKTIEDSLMAIGRNLFASAG